MQVEIAKALSGAQDGDRTTSWFNVKPGVCPGDEPIVVWLGEKKGGGVGAVGEPRETILIEADERLV